MILDGGRQLALYSVKRGTDGEGDPELGKTGFALERQSNRVNSDRKPTASGSCYVRTIVLKTITEMMNYTAGGEERVD